jgi:hypothetical protein
VRRSATGRFVIEALAMGDQILFASASSERIALSKATEMRHAFGPTEGREIVVRSDEGVLGWWIVRHCRWVPLGAALGELELSPADGQLVSRAP